MEATRTSSPSSPSSSSSASSSKKLFTPYAPLGLQHRIVMAPLTRVRGDDKFCASETAVTYYGERATPGGLVITEGSPVSPETQYEYAAGIYTPEQVEAWKKVTQAVHAKGGKIAIQLWHLGRMCHGSWAQNPYLRELTSQTDSRYKSLPSVSCSATTAPGASRDSSGQRGSPYPPARALTNEEIKTRLVEDFAQAARNAKEAGFDIVEIHGAHGYLFDQFFCSSTNLRTDEFGAQSIENRTRALGLVLNAVIKEMGSSQRVAIRISPTNGKFAYQGCQDATPEQTYPEIIRWLDQFKLGYLLISEPRWNGGRGNAELEADQTYNIPVSAGTWVKSVYSGFVVGSSSFSPLTAEKALQDGTYDAVAFGRLFISNPDLVERIRADKPLNVYDVNTFYIRDPVKGYIDYPTFDKAAAGGFPQLASERIGTKKPVKASL